MAENSITEKNTAGSGDLLRGLLPESIDRDTLLVAALLWLMLKEGGDLKLILALGYILF